MNNQNQFKSALVSIFPNKKSLESFIEDSGYEKTIKSILNFLQSKEVNIRNINELKDYIQKNSIKIEQNINVTFGDILENNSDLNIISSRDLVRRINQLLKQKQIDLPQINASILTRLKHGLPNTSKKRNVLRSLAFWVGYTKPHLINQYNYESLIHICTQYEKLWSENEGCRIAFSLYSRGDTIGNDAVLWLKSELNDYILNNIDFQIYKEKRKIQSLDITTFFVDIPKEISSNEGLHHPRSYVTCTNNAISLSYQISNRWALSKYSSKRRFLAIAMAVGELSNLDVYIRAILNTKLPEDPLIRMTDFAHQCVLINNIRIRFNRTPKEVEMITGEMMNVWWITEFWNTIYWDFIPSLLEDSSLQSEETLVDILWFQDDATNPISITDDKKSSSIFKYYRLPQNTVLGLEIAKTLYYRRKFWEANEIVRIILSFQPHNLIARSLRMSIFWNIGIHSTPFSVAETQFEFSEEDAKYIEDNNIPKDEEYICEFAYGKVAHAITAFRMLRKNNSKKINEQCINLNETQIFDLLDQSEALFKKAIISSPVGHRSLYWLICIPAFKEMLQKNSSLFENKNNKILDKHSLFYKHSERLFKSLGWLRTDYKEELQPIILEKRIMSAIKLQNESLSLRSYSPNISFCCAVIFWDFVPFLTVDFAIKILNFLNKAKNDAQKLLKDNLCIYSMTRFHGEILPAKQFINHIDNAINLVENRAGKIEELEEKDNNEIIENAKDDGTRLCLLNIFN